MCKLVKITVMVKHACIRVSTSYNFNFVYGTHFIVANNFYSLYNQNLNTTGIKETKQEFKWK